MSENKKPNIGHDVVITSLAMRFYVSNGWTEEKLKPYLTGSLEEKNFGPYDYYWILTVGSKLDVDRMFADGIIGLVTCKEFYGETKNLSDVDAMKRRNW